MPRITTANAREMAAKSHAARRQRLASVTPAAETIPQTPQLNVLQAADPYVNARLARVRLQLARLDDLLDSESDPQKIDRLASASARLAEQERQLANRPLPGSRKPAAERPTAPSRWDWLSNPVPVLEPVVPNHGPPEPLPVEPLPG